MPSKRTSTSLPFNPAIFVWARNRADYSQSEVADKIKVNIQKIIEWENLQSAISPTVNQARQLAELYGRPFLEFFAKEIPDIPETKLVPDFRTHANTSINHENKILKDVQAWSETQRLNAIDLFQINGEAVPTFPKELKATIIDNYEAVAAFARSVLRFSIEQQLSLRSNERINLVKIIRKKLEDIGVLILKNSDLGKCNARGLCIYNEVLPIIILSKESPNGSTFTLCHEFAHIILGESAVSDGIQKRREINAIEEWCNQFAGAFLIPENPLRRYINPIKKLAEISDDELNRLANRFSVSRHAMLVRLVQVNIVDADYYWQVKRPQFIEEEKNQPSGFGSTYYGSRYRNRNGDMYTGLVLEAWSNNRITNHNAAEFMDIKNIAHLYDIRNHFND